MEQEEGTAKRPIVQTLCAELRYKLCSSGDIFSDGFRAGASRFLLSSIRSIQQPS